MRRRWTVYIATAPDGRKYVGCTRQNLEDRARGWSRAAFPLLHGHPRFRWCDAVAIWGRKAMKVTSLSYHDTAVSAASAETAAIHTHGTFRPAGYNRQARSGIPRMAEMRPH